jgi:hypothetical protein
MSRRSDRLYTFLKLHNLVRVASWPTDPNPTNFVLSRARINATLSLCLVSIFSAQASPLSRRRRLWNIAVAEPKKEDDSLEPWVQAALGEEYDDACQSAFSTWGGIASPSDSLPLLRVSEVACTRALLKDWFQLFNMLVYTSLADLAPQADLKWAPDPDDSADLALDIDRLVGTTVSGSPAHSLALLTKGFWSMGIGDMAEARRYAFVLLSEFKQNGPAAHLAATQAFIQLLLPSALDLKLDAIKPPTNDVDVLAFTCLKWLDLRRQCSLMPAETTSKSLYQSSLAVRQLFNNPVWQQALVATPQTLCIQMAELLGRKAAGMA